MPSRHDVKPTDIFLVKASNPLLLKSMGGCVGTLQIPFHFLWGTHTCWYSLRVLRHIGMILYVTSVWYQGMKVLWSVLWQPPPLGPCFLDKEQMLCLFCVVNVYYYVMASRENSACTQMFVIAGIMSLWRNRYLESQRSQHMWPGAALLFHGLVAPFVSSCSGTHGSYRALNL